MGVPHHLMRAKCQYCGRPLRYANIPNRGPVMAHASGEGERCRRMQASGTDLVSRAHDELVRQVIGSIQRFAFRCGRLS